MSASKTSSPTSYSRAGSPSIDDLLADLEASVAAPPTYHDDTFYHPQTPSMLPAPSELNIDPEVPLWGYQLTALVTNSELSLSAINRSPPPVKFTTLGKDMGHPHGFGPFGEAARPASIQWDTDLVFMSQRPSGAVEESFVVNSGAAFGVEGYEDIWKQKVDKSPRRRSPRKATTPPASPAKRAPPQLVSRKSTATPAPASRQPTPRPQTSQKSAAAGPSTSVPVRQTRWTTQAEKTIIMMEA
ncbi:hypothetical protein BDZ89DRAFT_1136376 [Hymenopellis radicata]|nr:hypothetical protein BDZ89DRAFT_1136376 [Hymenopellis radicata]